MITLHFQFLPIPPFPHLKSFIHPFSTYFFAHLATLLPSSVRLNDSHPYPYPSSSYPTRSFSQRPRHLATLKRSVERYAPSPPPLATLPALCLPHLLPYPFILAATRHLATLKRSVERYAPPPTASYPTRSLSPPPRKLPLATLPPH
ncbi:hypothetical protein PGTUg99_018579 [Puccinia graminis f. sp. tritici]|uniref:Uncharacterized protein n=1 Tax=Puccinia graminis f. sp. tritici TaxID=56615 RepID=A0A5B0SFR0_PUCGR|nr:hypothetical protein PGTUg99_018579 [Puccinia graminis f. sp. tritici]